MPKNSMIFTEKSGIFYEIAILLLVIICKCAGSEKILKSDLKNVEKHISRKDCENLFEDFSRNTREAMGKEKFISLCKEMKGEVGSYIEELKNLFDRNWQKSIEGKDEKNSISVTYHASVTLNNGDVIEFVFEDGKWKIDSPLPDFYPNLTPKETIASFIKAFKAKRWDILTKFVPSNYSTEDDAKLLEKKWGEGEGWVKMNKLVMMIEQNKNLKTETDGSKATFKFAPGHSVEMVKEGGEWKILIIQ